MHTGAFLCSVPGTTINSGNTELKKIITELVWSLHLSCKRGKHKTEQENVKYQWLPWKISFIKYDHMMKKDWVTN